MSLDLTRMERNCTFRAAASQLKMNIPADHTCFISDFENGKEYDRTPLSWPCDMIRAYSDVTACIGICIPDGISDGPQLIQATCVLPQPRNERNGQSSKEQKYFDSKPHGPPPLLLSAAFIKSAVSSSLACLISSQVSAHTSSTTYHTCLTQTHTTDPLRLRIRKCQPNKLQFLPQPQYPRRPLPTCRWARMDSRCQRGRSRGGRRKLRVSDIAGT